MLAGSARRIGTLFELANQVRESFRRLADNFQVGGGFPLKSRPRAQQLASRQYGSYFVIEVVSKTWPTRLLRFRAWAQLGYGLHCNNSYREYCRAGLGAVYCVDFVTKTEQETIVFADISASANRIS